MQWKNPVFMGLRDIIFPNSIVLLIDLANNIFINYVK